MFLFVFYYNLLLSKRDTEIEETSGKYKTLKKKYMTMKIKKIKEKEKEKKNKKKINDNISIDGILNNMEQNSLFEEDNNININNDNDSIFSSLGSKSLMYGQFDMNTEYNL
jgi:hypothetical protein